MTDRLEPWLWYGRDKAKTKRCQVKAVTYVEARMLVARELRLKEHEVELRCAFEYEIEAAKKGKAA